MLLKPVLRAVRSFERGWGGDTSNAAIAVARLGKRSGYITNIGDDEFGRSFMDLWRREKVDVSTVRVVKNGFTGVYFIAYHNGHQFTYRRKGSAASRLCPSDVDEEHAYRSRVFHSSGITAAISQSCRRALLQTARRAKRKGVTFSLDVNYRPKLWPKNVAIKYIREMMGLADIVFQSLEDLRLLFGNGTPAQLSKRILKYGPHIVATKMGSQGCLITRNDRNVIVEGFRVKAVDPTGAGDAFDGAFLCGLLENWDIEKCARFGNAVGVLTSTGKGATTPIPHRKQVEELIDRCD